MVLKIDILPCEIIVYILSFVNNQDYHSLMLSHRIFNVLNKEEILKRENICLREYPSTFYPMYVNRKTIDEIIFACNEENVKYIWKTAKWKQEKTIFHHNEKKNVRTISINGDALKNFINYIEEYDMANFVSQCPVYIKISSEKITFSYNNHLFSL